MADVEVFVSYSHVDNEASYDRILKASNDVRRTYRSLSGLEVGLFIDTEAESIDIGDLWRDRIRSGLIDATILLAFISPLYLASRFCRSELQEFISVLSDTGSQKFIIPLLFTPAQNIEERFRNDELWIQAVSLQYLDSHELRIEEPGSKPWMEKVTLIAERMRRALVIPDLSIPPSTGSIVSSPPSSSEPGTLKLLADLQTNLPVLNESINELASILADFNEKVVNATPRMAQAELPTQKLAVANELASQLAPIADQFMARTLEFQSSLEAIDPGIRVTFRTLRNKPRDKWSDDEVQFGGAVRTLAEIALASTTSMDEFATSIGNAKGFSSDLDKPLQRLQSATLILSGDRGIYKHWLDEIEELDSSTEQ